jgi:RND family efflux transporter MFP subunit
MKAVMIKHPIKKLIVLTSLLGATGLCLATQKAPEAAAPVSPKTAQKVLISPVEQLQLTATRRYPGTVKASRETQLAFRISGPLVAIDVAPGETIRQGQRLMQVDPRDYKDRIAVLNAQLAAARSDLEHSKQDYDRAVTLFEQQVNAKADYDRAKSAFDRAVAMEQSLKAELQIARHQLEDTTLTAPYDGMVINQRVENYEMIQAGQVVMCVQDISTLEVEIHLPENEIVKYPLAKDLLYLKEWTARADEVTRTYTLTFRFTPPVGSQILPGMTADVYWQAPSAQSSQLSIPTNAVFSAQDRSTFVWVYDTDHQQVLKRAIEIGSLTGENTVELVSGLNGNEWLVVAGSSNTLMDGMHVEAHTTQEQRM